MRSIINNILLACLAAGAMAACSEPRSRSMPQSPPLTGAATAPSASPEDSDRQQTATFGGGCFWCTEGVFQQVRGVKSVMSGYSGGRTSHPTYEQICTGATGHAEVIQVTFDPQEVSYADLLEIFWRTHDPTTRNRQGNDVGTQYRSVIFHHNDEQRRLAEEYKQKLDASGAFSRPIVTEIAPFQEFFPAEAYHQNYFNDNSEAPYCQFVIVPKLEKFRAVFKDKLKPSAGP